MIKIAVRSFAYHRTAAIATGLVALVGTILVTSMMTLLGTGLAPSTAAADRAFLVQFPLIMGGWTVAIVLFAMVSTISVALAGRAGEIAGIRLIGASPRQVQWMLVVETAAVTAVTAPPGLAGGYLVGQIVTDNIQSAGLTGATSVFAPGALLPVLGVLVVLAASVLAAWIGSRSLAHRSPIADATPLTRHTPDPTPRTHHTPTSEPTPHTHHTPTSEPTPHTHRTPTSEPTPHTHRTGTTAPTAPSQRSQSTEATPPAHGTPTTKPTSPAHTPAINPTSPAHHTPTTDTTPPARRGRPGRGRRITATLMIIAGLSSSAAVLGMDPSGVLTTAMTGPGCVLVAVGLCVLAPELIAIVNRMSTRRTHRAAPSHLAAINLSAAPDRVRPTVTFLTLFVGVAAGTLSMQGIENVAGTTDSTGQVLASINYFVVALIAAFMAIALTNNLVASISQRRTEFATMSLIGSTSTQTHRMLVREIGAATAISVVAGSVGAFLAVLPFAIVKTGNPLQAATPLPYAITIAIGISVTLGVASLVGKHVIRTATP